MKCFIEGNIPCVYLDGKKEAPSSYKLDGASSSTPEQANELTATGATGTTAATAATSAAAATETIVTSEAVETLDAIEAEETYSYAKTFSIWLALNLALALTLILRLRHPASVEIPDLQLLKILFEICHRINLPT